MQVAVGDTSPINYLILIDHVDLIPRLFDGWLLPTAVAAELTSARTPARVRQWMPLSPRGSVSSPIRRTCRTRFMPSIVGSGWRSPWQCRPRQTIILVDDRVGVDAARALGLRSVGTIGVLDAAARLGLINFEDSIERLAHTNFQMPSAIVDRLIAFHRAGEG